MPIGATVASAGHGHYVGRETTRSCPVGLRLTLVDAADSRLPAERPDEQRKTGCGKRRARRGLASRPHGTAAEEQGQVPGSRRGRRGRKVDRRQCGCARVCASGRNTASTRNVRSHWGGGGASGILLSPLLDHHPPAFPLSTLNCRVLTCFCLPHSRLLTLDRLLPSYVPPYRRASLLALVRRRSSASMKPWMSPSITRWGLPTSNEVRWSLTRLS